MRPVHSHLPRYLFICLALAACTGKPIDHPNTKFDYPATARGDQIDEYHGTSVADPYRWLEDDVRENSAVSQWVDAQNAVTVEYLSSINERTAVEQRLTELWDYERYSVPIKAGDQYFYSYNDGLQNQDVVYVQANLDSEPELLLDPNRWSEDGTVALAAYFPSPDGNYLAYLVQDGGSDWREARILDVRQGVVLDDRLAWLKFTALEWSADSSGFYYSRYPEVADEDRFQSLNKNMRVQLHRLGDDQAEDDLVWARPDRPDWRADATVTDDGNHLILTIGIGTDDRYQIAYKDLRDDAAEIVTLIEGFDHDYTLIGSVGDELYFRTNDGAPRHRIIAIDTKNPAPASWREVVAESENVLADVSLVGRRLIGQYMQDAWSVIQIVDLNGAPLESVDLPGIGTTYGFEGTEDDPETFFAYTSYNTPGTINRLDVETGEVSVFRQPELVFDPDDYVVEQRFYESEDGTRVPMFVSHRRDLEPDGNLPTLLYGYGGFNISLTPGFSVSRLAWMEMGGVYAVANLRGGGEYGTEWHKAGTKLQKQNVFDDFIAAAEYLIDSGYTNSHRLAIFGGSNGGLLVGAVTNQRPELFAAALPAVGVMDMLRFQNFTAGQFWTDDYGSAEDPDEFQALHAYSPYHNLKPDTAYPAILVTTADTDDRVVPGHSFKYAAAAQRAQAGDAPVLIRIETRAGHGAGVPTEKVIAEYADRWAFLVENLDMRLPEGYGR